MVADLTGRRAPVLWLRGRQCCRHRLFGVDGGGVKEGHGRIVGLDQQPDLRAAEDDALGALPGQRGQDLKVISSGIRADLAAAELFVDRSEEHTSELQSRPHLVCRLLLEKKKN